MCADIDAAGRAKAEEGLARVAAREPEHEEQQKRRRCRRTKAMGAASWTGGFGRALVCCWSLARGKRSTAGWQWC